MALSTGRHRFCISHQLFSTDSPANLVQESAKCVWAEFIQRFWGSFYATTFFSDYLPLLFSLANSPELCPLTPPAGKTAQTKEWELRQRAKETQVASSALTPLQFLPAFGHPQGPISSCGGGVFFSYLTQFIIIMVICRRDYLRLEPILECRLGFLNVIVLFKWGLLYPSLSWDIHLSQSLCRAANTKQPTNQFLW